jgi:mannan endo-1,4-beta-mannosidase
MFSIKKTMRVLSSIALFFIVPLCLCGNNPTPPPGPLIVCGDTSHSNTPANSQRFGFFSDRLYGNYSRNLDSLITMFGAVPGYVLWFQQIDDAFPVQVVSVNAGRGIATVISLGLKSIQLDSARNDTLLREIALEVWDSTLSEFAKQAKLIAVPVYLRFGYEMNGYWFSWGEKPAEFVSAWNHAYRVFTREQADNVKWVFAPGVLWGGLTPDHDLFPYYPGDSVVDAVGLDGYNFGADPSNGHQWQWFEEIFGASLMAVQTLKKPVWITEIGCATDSRRPDWLEQVFMFMDKNPCIETMLWFNMHKAGEPDFRLEADSASIVLMKNWLAR